MPFEIGPEELRAMARLEEEAGCDVEAGLAWGADAGEYLKRMPARVEHQGDENPLGQRPEKSSDLA